MIVDLGPLRAERGATLVVACNDIVASQIPDLPFDEPVTGELTLANLGGVLRVTGHVDTSVGLVCDRCTRRFRYHLHADIGENLDWAGGGDFIVGSGPTLMLNAGALVREMLVMALPMVARCDENCIGLCGRCGADLRNGPCGCESEAQDERLAPLARLREPREGRTDEPQGAN
jgi:uncharacterized protein